MHCRTPRRARRACLPILGSLLLLIALVAPAPAFAGDAREVTIPLASGKSIEGVVESADAKEVVIRLGPESVRRIPWAQLAPLGLYRVKAALAPAADGDARLALAELAVELGLHAEARIEFEKALALGAITQKAFQAVVAKAEQDAVETGVKRSLKLADDGEWEQALELARDLKMHFSGAPNAAAIDKLIHELLQRVRNHKKAAEQASKELERVKVEALRNKEILKRRTSAIGKIEVGRKEAEKAGAAREKGNVTRARKHAEAADKAFMTARRDLGRLRRIVPRGEEAYVEILALLNTLDDEQFALLHATAWFFWEQTVYSRADEYAARASYIDPVHPDLLDLRDLLRTNRIRYRLSDMTNARPIVR
jgi:hypothetical protein